MSFIVWALYVGDVWFHVNYKSAIVGRSPVITDNARRFDVASTSKVCSVGELSQSQMAAGAPRRAVV